MKISYKDGKAFYIKMNDVSAVKVNEEVIDFYFSFHLYTITMSELDEGEVEKIMVEVEKIK